MEANFIEYDFDKSLQRIDEILNASSDSYQERQSIPSRSQLTYTNGFYVNCTAIFVDICDSSNLTNEHRRPVLGKIYRSFISELVASFNGFRRCKEVNINGDCVWAVFEASSCTDIDSAFFAACQAGSLVDVLNCKLSKKGYATYKVGIGIDYGRALMIKAGYKGSCINDVIWMGDVVNSACHLSANGSKGENA